MRISRLELRDFRRYRDLSIDLAPGLTIIRGPNEAGKSTIQRAIELVLTRRVTSGASDLAALRPWDAEAGTDSVVSLTFRHEEDDGPREGTLIKTFAGNRGTVRLDYDGQTLIDPVLVDQTLAELTGIPTEGFFRSTASVHHQELTGLDQDPATIRDRLQTSISGADKGTSRAKAKLGKSIHELTTRGDKNPGGLKVAELAVAEASSSVEGGEAALAQLSRDRDTLSGALARRSEADVALAERRSMLEKARQAERLVTERDAAQERYERFRQAVVVNEELSGLATSHPSSNALPVLRAGVERLRTLDTRARELRAALAGEVEVSFEAAAPPTWAPLRRWGLVLVVLGLVVAGITAAADLAGILDLPPVAPVVGGVVAVIGLVLLVVVWWLRRSYQSGEQLRDVEIDRRLRGRSEMEAELVQVDTETERRLGALGLEDLTSAEDLLTREEAHVAQIDRLSSQLQGLVGNTPPETLAQQRDAASLEIEQKTSALEGLGPIAKEPRARERLEAEVREHEGALERARDDEANARARVEANVVDAEQVAADAERLAVGRETLEALQRRHRVYATTLASIEGAEQATMKTATRYLERHMVRDLATATDGRYQRARVDDKTLDIELFAPEKGDWVKVGDLSQGTLDLVYLTARLGLVRLVTGDRRPPLILDDPFVSLDDERAPRALQLLKALSTDFQVIYLTTSSRYDAAADAIQELPGPTLRDQPPPVGPEGAATEPAPAPAPADEAASGATT